jgi:hypothetical protein
MRERGRVVGIFIFTNLGGWQSDGLKITSGLQIRTFPGYIFLIDKIHNDILYVVPRTLHAHPPPHPPWHHSSHGSRHPCYRVVFHYQKHKGAVYPS